MDYFLVAHVCQITTTVDMAKAPDGSVPMQLLGLTWLSKSLKRGRHGGDHGEFYHQERLPENLRSNFGISSISYSMQ